MHAQDSSRSAKRIWAERAVFAAIIVGVGIWTAISRVQSVPCTIVVDGKPVVSVESRGAAKTVLSHVRFQQMSGIPAGAVRFAQNVALRQAAKNAELVDLPEAARAVEKAVTVEAESFAITADGMPIVALASREDAEETLRLVKRHHERGMRNLCTESVFKESVLVEKRYVDVQKLYSSPEEAARFLTSITEKPTIHVVQQGDRAVNLAQQYGVAFTELKKLNPQLDLDRLVEGDRLLIRKAKEPVTVISKSLVTNTVTIVPPPEMLRHGRSRIGKRVTKTLTTFENGEPVSEEIISQVTTWEKAPESPTKSERR